MEALGAYVRKKGMFLVVVSVFPVIAIALSYSGALAARVTASWSYDYTRQPACSSTRVNDCIDHFEILDYTESRHPKLLCTVANPADAIGKVDNISDEFSYGPPFGLRTIVVVAVARDEKGVVIASNPYAARKDVDIRPKVGHLRELRCSAIGHGEPRPHFRSPIRE
jgi:hypothetical protein